jgi:hypothetical protein
MDPRCTTEESSNARHDNCDTAGIQALMSGHVQFSGSGSSALVMSDDDKDGGY